MTHKRQAILFLAAITLLFALLAAVGPAPATQCADSGICVKTTDR